MLVMALSGCKAGRTITVINKTSKPLDIYTANPDPAVPGRVPFSSVPANSTVDINIDINEGCQRYALEALDGQTPIARREGPTCVGDAWTINRV